MRKYYLIFKLTFLIDVLFIFAWPDVSAALWADWSMIVCLAALIYQLAYLFILRKKEKLKNNKHLGKRKTKQVMQNV